MKTKRSKEAGGGIRITEEINRGRSIVDEILSQIRQQTGIEATYTFVQKGRAHLTIGEKNYSLTKKDQAEAVKSKQAMVQLVLRKFIVYSPKMMKMVPR